MIRRFSTLAKKTPLFDIQQKLNPVIGTFAGYDLPMNFNYNKTNVVVKGIRNNGIGIFDTSHMGIIKLIPNNKSSLNDIKILIEQLFPINTDILKPNRSGLTVLMNTNGFVQDDLIISNIDDSYYRLVVNAATKNNIFYLLNQFNKLNEMYIDIKQDDKIILAIQGSKSHELLEELTNINYNNLYFNDNIRINKDFEIARTGYTGEDGFELYCNNNYGREIYNKIINMNKNNIYFGGLIERDILRMEAGLCLSGNEFGKHIDINFYDLDMDFLIGKRRRNNGGFIGYNNINNKKKNRIGITSDRPLKEKDIIYSNNKPIGIITSATKSFNLNKFISIGYIDLNVNDDIYTIKNNKKIELVKTKLPFIKTNFKK